MNLHDPEFAAGAMYVHAAGCVSQSDYDELAHHIIAVCGKNQFKRAIWKSRLLDDGRKPVTCDTFHDYLFKPQRDGLGVTSPALLDGILRGLKKDGPEALAIVMREVPEWEELVRDSRPDAAEFAEQQGVGFDNGGDRRSEQFQNNNVILKTSRQGNDRNYTLRRLQKHAPKLFARVKSGDMSANEAAIKAGFRKATLTISTDPAKAAQTILAKFSDDQVKQMLRAIRSGLKVSN